MLVHLGFGRDQDHLVDEPNPEKRAKSQFSIKLKLIAYIWDVYLLLFMQPVPKREIQLFGTEVGKEKLNS